MVKENIEKRERYLKMQIAGLFFRVENRVYRGSEENKNITNINASQQPNQLPDLNRSLYRAPEITYTVSLDLFSKQTDVLILVQKISSRPVLLLPLDILVPICQHADTRTIRRMCTINRATCRIVRPFVFKNLHIMTKRIVTKLIEFGSRNGNEHIATGTETITFYRDHRGWPAILAEEIEALLAVFQARKVIFFSLGGGYMFRIGRNFRPHEWGGTDIGLSRALNAGLGINLSAVRLWNCTFEEDGLADVLDFNRGCLQEISLIE
jgi:hypothetical protein